MKLVYTYQAENYCKNCGNALRAELDAKGLTPKNPEDPASYDSGDYPKPYYGEMESDYIELCGSGSECLNAILLDIPPEDLKGAEESSIGVILTDTLTPHGLEYTAEFILTPNATPYQTALKALYFDTFPELEEYVQNYLVEHGADLQGVELGRDMYVNVPRWIEQDIDLPSVIAIAHGGCESGAYMPAVIYSQALDTMRDYGNEIFDYLEDHAGGIPDVPPDRRSWAGMAVFYVSYAVETWAYAVLSELNII